MQPSFKTGGVLRKNGSLVISMPERTHVSQFQQHAGGFCSVSMVEGVPITGISSVYVYFLCVYMHTYIHTYICVLGIAQALCRGFKFCFAYAHPCVCTHARMCMYTCVCARNIHMRVRAHFEVNFTNYANHIIPVLVVVSMYMCVCLYECIHTCNQTLWFLFFAGDEIFFFGIIDFLQEYTAKKRSETFVRSLFYRKREISCVSVLPTSSLCMYVCMYVCMYACMCAYYIYIYIYIYSERRSYA